MSKTMAEVLAEHSVGSVRVGSHVGLRHMPDIGVYESRCSTCGTITGSTAAHQAAALSAAGFGLVTDAKAEALTEAAEAVYVDGSYVNATWLASRAAAERRLRE